MRRGFVHAVLQGGDDEGGDQRGDGRDGDHLPLADQGAQIVEFLHSAPRPVRTTMIVRKRIFVSSQRLHSFTYSLSSRNLSSSVVRLRPFTCQSPVMPGRT